MEDEDDWDCSSGARILGISYSPDRDDACYAALISPEGEVVDYVKLSYLLASRSVRYNTCESAGNHFVWIRVTVVIIYCWTANKGLSVTIPMTSDADC